MKPVFNNRSAFNTVQNEQQNDKVTYLATKKAEQILSNNDPLQLSKNKFGGQQLSPIVSLLLSIFISLVKNSSKQQIGQKIGSSIFTNILSTHIKLPLIRLIANIIEKKLYRSQGQDTQISYSVIFKNCLLSVFLSIVSENSALIGMDKLVNLHRNLLAENYILYMPIYLYFMYGGGLFTIERKTFKNYFNKLLNNVSYVLSKQETIITRNFQQIKKNKFQSDILAQSLNIVCCSANKEYLEQISQSISRQIFGDKQYVKKQQFCDAIVRFQQSDKRRQFLFFFLNLMRLQFQILQSSKTRQPKPQNQQINQTSFYATQMQKILKKCPYNGDNKCDCKKCQCVRRNRQSAKLSQEKKRNAVQQIEPMRQKIVELEAKNKQLQEENMILKGLLNSLKCNPQFKSLLMNTIEPVSKILRDN